ncbi:MAG TPA: dynamin family protein [Candidatus Binatia bacterium]|jgi:GTP-binding protein EngB required for normal cell division
MNNSATPSGGLKLASVSKVDGGAANDLRELLGRFRLLCEESGRDLSDCLTRVAELQERLSANRFHLAVLGQFKRGKSTLLNALLGEPLLPTGVVPLTSIPTFLLAGATRTVRVFFDDGREADFANLTRERASEVLCRHVTEKENPRNKLGVARVEVEHSSALLSAGVVLIDTPGIGSTLRHNTEATLNFLPQCDAALFVVSADPPITEVEKEFLKAVQPRVAKICFVMNKVDYLNEDELQEAVKFFEGALKGSGFPEQNSIFTVSARRGIGSRIHEKPLLWRQSGLQALQDYLLDFLSREKSRILQLALARKAIAAVADASMNIKLRQRALQLSQQELEKRLEIFDTKVNEIAQEKVKLGDLLAGDRKRSAQFLEELAEALRNASRRHFGEVITRGMKSNGKSIAEEQTREQIAEEIPVFFAPKLASFSGAVNDVLTKALTPHQERLDGMISALRSTAAELFDVPYRPPLSDGRLEELHKPYWVTQKWNTSVSPVPEGFLDRFLPVELRRHRLQKRLEDEVETLVARNVENIRWATLRNLDDAFRRFASNLDQRLREAGEATHEAMRATLVQRKQSAGLAAPEIRRLEQKAAALAQLEDDLAKFLRRCGDGAI